MYDCHVFRPVGSINPAGVKVIFSDAVTRSLTRLKQRVLFSLLFGKTFIPRIFVSLTFSEASLAIFTDNIFLKDNKLKSEISLTDLERVYQEPRTKLSPFVRYFLNKLKMYAKNKYKEKLQYVWRLERGTKKGRLHLHLLFANSFPGMREKLFQLWDMCEIQAYDYQNIDDSLTKTCIYVSKYCSKVTHSSVSYRYYYAIYGRKFSTSRGISIPKDKYVIFNKDSGMWEVRTKEAMELLFMCVNFSELRSKDQDFYYNFINSTYGTNVRSQSGLRKLHKFEASNYNIFCKIKKSDTVWDCSLWLPDQDRIDYTLDSSDVEYPELLHFNYSLDDYLIKMRKAGGNHSIRVSD